MSRENQKPEMKFKRKSKTMFEKILYVLLLIGMIASVVFAVLDAGDVTFSMYCVICIIAGSLIGLADVFFSSEILLWIASLLYAAGFGFHLYAALPSISDLWNHVNFIGGNQSLAITFGSIFAVVMLALLASNFVIDREKKIIVE